MFAVMKTGGKQYKVQSGDTLRVEKLAADAGETVQFNDILMLGGDSTVVGAPFVAGAAVQADGFLLQWVPDDLHPPHLRPHSDLNPH